MGIEDKKQLLKTYYDNDKFKGFYTEHCENITQIDFDGETVFYYVYVTASCGCCSYTEDREHELNYFLNYLTDSDFEMLLNELKQNT